MCLHSVLNLKRFRSYNTDFLSVFRSLSFVTCMGCLSFLLLAVMYFAMDIKEWWGGQPFIYPGTSINFFKAMFYKPI